MSNDLVSVRGLTDFDEPLRQFTGIFDGHERVPASGYEGWRVNLNFKDIDNVTAAPGTVYNLPTYVMNLSLSNKNKSKWGYFGNSLAVLLPPDEDIKDCKDRAMTLVYCDGVDGRPSPKPIWNRDADRETFPDGMVPTPVWTVTAIDGVSAGEAADSGQSASDLAEEQMIGKTRAEFNKWAYSNPQIRKDVALQRSITDKSFVNGLVTLGRVHEDADGVFQPGPAEE